MRPWLIAIHLDKGANVNFYLWPDVSEWPMKTPAQINIEVFIRHRIGMVYGRNLFKMAEKPAEPLRPVIHHDHAFARVASRPPKEVVLMTAEGLGKSHLRAEEIDGAGLAVVLAKDGAAAAVFRTEPVVSSVHRLRHLAPTEVVRVDLRKQADGNAGAR